MYKLVCFCLKLPKISLRVPKKQHKQKNNRNNHQKMTATKTTFAKKTVNKPLYAFRPDVGFLVCVW